MERRASEQGEKGTGKVSARRPFYYVSRFARLSFRFSPGAALPAGYILGASLNGCHNTSRRKRPVWPSSQAAISSGVPAQTTSPPACPPSGPKSMT